MPRAQNQEVHIAPIKGLITEASPFTFPENAFTEGFDIKLDTTSRLLRRKGFEYETSHTLTTSLALDSSSVVHEFVWKTAGGSGENNFVVVQLGATLHFFNMSTLPLSANKHATTVALSTYAVAGASSIESEHAFFANGDGVLFVFHPQCEPFYITYEDTADVIDSAQITIEIRDLEGVEDETTSTNDRPSSLTTLHNYNLDNQGWADTVSTDDAGDIDPIVDWDAGRADFPSNADVWWYYRNATFNNFDLDNVDTVSIGNTPAPKGHFFLNPFNEDRNAVSGFTGIPDVTTNGKRPSTGAFFAGRVWYAGVPVTGWNSNLYFSTIALDTKDYGKCHQINDPTSSEQSDLLSSDGGVLTIQDCGTILHLHTVQNLLLVFATNGVWSISGSEGTGFKATDFSVSKISEFSVIGSHNIVSVDGMPVWWNTDGIYRINIEPNLGTISVQSISDTTIKTFIDGIPDGEKQYIKGSYDPFLKIVTWLYRTTASSNIRQRSQFNAAIMLDIKLEAFYPWTISEPSSGPQIYGVVSTAANPAKETETFFLTLVETATDVYSLTFSQEWDTDYLDWTTFDATGTDYSSYVIMGHSLSGKQMLKFTNNYLIFLTDTLANSSCIMRGLWSYANAVASNKYSVGQEIYPAKTNVGIQEKKLKLRGSGRAVQVKLESVTGKPFSVVGWSVFVLVQNIP